MTMLKRLYYWLYRATSRSDEKGEYSGGRWEGMVRNEAVELCKGAQGKALEIGSGAGLFVLKLAAREPRLEVWGADTVDSMVQYVLQKARDRSLANIHVVLQDGRKLSFADGTFDRVVCINLFLNMKFELIAELLKEMMRVCNTSGRIIFEFRNSRNLLFVLKYKLAKYYDSSAPYPLYTYHPRQFTALLRDLGLEAVNTKYLGFPVKSLAPIILIEAKKI
jgi:ubiquinone/menaquinone biosynthesis C-methylase UbiE